MQVLIDFQEVHNALGICQNIKELVAKVYVKKSQKFIVMQIEIFE